jgi:Flp pilus assembly protein TadB
MSLAAALFGAWWTWGTEAAVAFLAVWWSRLFIGAAAAVVLSVFVWWFWWRLPKRQVDRLRHAIRDPSGSAASTRSKA